MADFSRWGWVFPALGLLIIGALAWWMYQIWLAAAPAVPSNPFASARSAGPPAPAQPGSPPAAPSLAAADPGHCPPQPLVAPGTPGDGQFSLRLAPAAGESAGAAAFVQAAEEVAAQGRPRDAEVALLAACRMEAVTSGAASAPVADLKSALGQHYAAVAERPEAAGQRTELLQRAQQMFGESAQAYAAALGAQSSKARLAQQRLDTVNRMASAAAGAPARDGPAGASAVTPAPDPNAMGAAAGSAEAAAAEDRILPECAGAGTASERLVCSDPELAQLDRDLDRLRAQARAVTRDPGGFAARQEQAWAQRESGCRGNKGCLRTWYGQRKRQLLQEF